MVIIEGEGVQSSKSTMFLVFHIISIYFYCVVKNLFIMFESPIDLSGNEEPIFVVKKPNLMMKY